MKRKSVKRKQKNKYVKRFAPVTQSVEQRTLNPKVVGSSPTRRTKDLVHMRQWLSGRALDF